MGGENPDWLPVGWKVSVRVRSCGKKDKYYVNRSKGLKFNSKPEVLRYLESSGKDRKPKELSKIDIKKTVAGQLPPGWIKEIKTTKKGGKTRRDPCYIDPVSGRHFRSMQEVFRYLESKDSQEANSKPDGKGHVSVEFENHSPSVSRLSSAEAKGQRSIDEKADKSLTGNESVKSGRSLASGLKGAAMENVKMPEDNHLEQRVKQHAADRMIQIKKLADNRVDKSADGDKRSKSGALTLKSCCTEKVDMPVLEQRDGQDDSVAGNLPKKLPQANVKEQLNGGRRRSMRLADSKLKDNVTKDRSLQSGSEGAAEKNINTPERNESEQKCAAEKILMCPREMNRNKKRNESEQKGAAEKNINMPERNESEQRETVNNSMGEGQQHENLARQKKRKTPNNKCTSDLPRRTSKRLARVEVDQSLEIKTSNKAGASATLSGEAEVNTTKNVGKSGPSDEPQIDITGKSGNDSNEHRAKCKTENSTNNIQEKPITHANKGVGVDCKQEEKHDKNLDSSLKNLLMDPCIEFAIKTLTGAIPIEEVTKVGESSVSSLSSPASSSVLPSGDILADPCFEFAVKMLTGEMPVEDGSRYQISFQQPVISSSRAVGCNSSASPVFMSDNVYPSIFRLANLML
ncbi:hypothetical protein DH2020_030960 [Rehmannia glutinosa]|uniref:MBD domain-containing protein n=1 Tax=Rehmannia glutinosa TaxID=99300 RepID=A0ABR0VL48_REHGL